MNTAYDRDFHAWTQEQAALLRAGHFSELDIEHLTEELESIGASDKRELASRLTVLLTHLLKWQHQGERRGVGCQLALDHRRTTPSHSPLADRQPQPEIPSPSIHRQRIPRRQGRCQL